MDEHESFVEFVSARGRALTRTAYVLTGDQHLAEDLLQNVLAKVARHWTRIESKGRAEAYIRSALYREFVSWRRLRRNSEVPQEHLPEVEIGSQDDLTVLRIVLERALLMLTRKQRAVIVLRYFEDRSAADAAGVLGCSVGAVKSQTHHALRRLRELAPELAGLLDDSDSAAPRTTQGSNQSATPGNQNPRAYQQEGVG